MLAENHLGECPDLILNSYDLSITPLSKLIAREPNKDTIKLPYIPGNFHYMMFELSKNAIKATVEHHKNKPSLPPIDIQIIKTHSVFVINISDQASGMSRSTMSKCFKYLHTSSEPVSPEDASNHRLNDMLGQSAYPFCGLGYGLPMSRLVARCFSGSMSMSSTPGAGSKVCIKLEAEPKNALERVPDNKSGDSKKIYEAQLISGDWTGDLVEDETIN